MNYAPIKMGGFKEQPYLNECASVCIAKNIMYK